MFLEQVILKYNAAGTCINIKDIHEVCNLSQEQTNCLLIQVLQHYLVSALLINNRLCLYAFHLLGA